MGIGNLQTSTKIFAHGDPGNHGTVRTRSLHTSTFIGSVLTQGIAGPGVRYWLSLARRALRPPAPVVAPYGDLTH